MGIHIAVTEDEILACYPVMRELRPHIPQTQFLQRITRQQQAGYRLCYLRLGAAVVAVAGFRLSENLAWGRFLYVDDLVTLPAQRSQGHGSQLLSWLKAYGAERGCSQLHLDTGLQRKDAHRFYAREGMDKTGFHYATNLAP